MRLTTTLPDQPADRPRVQQLLSNPKKRYPKMNRSVSKQSLARLCLAAALGASLVSGAVSCESKKERAAEASAASVADFQQQLDQMPALIDSTMNRLIAVTTGQNPNRADDFREFQKDLSSMRDRARMVAAEYEKASRNTSEYFRQWARESDRTPSADRATIDAEIAQSEARRNIALGHFNAARRDFTNLINTLDGVEKSLAGNLTEANVQALGTKVGSAITDAGKLRDQIARLDDMISAALAPKG